MTIAELADLLLLLETHGKAKATFFLIWSETKYFSGSTIQLVEMLRDSGHEIGIHFDGRWGCLMPDDEICKQTAEAMHALQRHCRVVPRYVRMPGGFSRRTTVTKLESFGLRVVNGTAYPFDVDLCKWQSAEALGRAAANMGRRGGRIAILHDRKNLYDKVCAFLEQAEHNRCEVVRLDTLLEDIELDVVRPIPVLNL